MSKLGNISFSYGKQLNISIANTYSYILMNGENLPQNTIIISSPVDENNEDLGSYSIIVTDNEGSPIRLSYCIKEGNGLYSDSNDDHIISLNIDNDTIYDSNSGLAVDLTQYNHNSIYSDDNILRVDTSKIILASYESRGITSIDNKSIKSADDQLYINTENLSYADNTTSTYGIISSSDETISIDNGVITLNIDKLPHASNENYGIAKGDEMTITCLGDSIQVNTNNLTISSGDEFGLINVDNNKIISDGGILKVDSSKLNKSSIINKGILSIDNSSIKLNDNQQITISKYSEMINKLTELNDKMNDTKKSLDDIKNNILIQSK